jgi:uncharacterized protein (DUF2236 family)
MDAARVSWRINAERIVLVGWIRALLLQLAHPLIAAGVADHSTFRGSTVASLGRLRQTVDAMLAITFGTPIDRQRSLQGIRTIHRRVRGTLAQSCGVFAAGTPYSAEDADLLVWVHATLVESIVLAYERLVAPLSAAERDRYCADSADVAVELGARTDAVPRSWDAVREYIEREQASGRIVVGTQARALASVLLSPLQYPLARQFVAAGMSLLAALACNRRRARRFTWMMTVLRRARRMTPAQLALWKCARSVDCFGKRHGYSTAR